MGEKSYIICSLYGLQDIKDKNDKRRKYFVVYFCTQIALNIILECYIVYSIKTALKNGTYFEDKFYRNYYGEQSFGLLYW